MLQFVLHLDEEGVVNNSIAADLFSKKLYYLHHLIVEIFKLDEEMWQNMGVDRKKLVPRVSEITPGSVVIPSYIAPLPGVLLADEHFRNSYSRFCRMIDLLNPNEHIGVDDKKLIPPLRYLKELCSKGETNSDLKFVYNTSYKQVKLDKYTRERASTLLEQIKTSKSWIYAIITGSKKNLKITQESDEYGSEDGMDAEESTKVNDYTPNPGADGKINVNFQTTEGKNGKVEILEDYYKNNEDYLRIDSIVQIIGKFDYQDWMRAGSVSNFQEVVYITKLETYNIIKKKYAEKMNTMLMLEEGWDDRDAKAIKKETVEDAYMVLCVFEELLQNIIPKNKYLIVAPGYDGSIDIEFKNADLDLYIKIPEEDDEIIVVLTFKSNKLLLGVKKMKFFPDIVEQIRGVLT